MKKNLGAFWQKVGASEFQTVAHAEWQLFQQQPTLQQQVLSYTWDGLGQNSGLVFPLIKPPGDVLKFLKINILIYIVGK